MQPRIKGLGSRNVILCNITASIYFFMFVYATNVFYYFQIECGVSLADLNMKAGIKIERQHC